MISLLTIPITCCQAYLHIKWNNMRWIYYTMILGAHFIYSLTYSVFAVLLYRDICFVGNEDNSMEHPHSDLIQCIAKELEPSLIVLDLKVKMDLVKVTWWLLIMFIITYVVKEVTRLIHFKIHMLKQLEFWIDVAIIVMFFCTFLPGLTLQWTTEIKGLKEIKGPKAGNHFLV